MKTIFNAIGRGLMFFEADNGAGSGGAAGSGGTTGAGGTGDGAGSGGTEGAGTGAGGEGNKETGAKLFSQEDLNRIATAEKAQGEKAALKKLGYEDAAALKKDLEEFNKSKKDAQTDLDKANEKAATAEGAASQAKLEKELLQMKLDAIKADAIPATVDDLILLVRARVTDDKSFEKALVEAKTAYPSFFAETDTSAGSTGGINNPPRGKLDSKTVVGIGKRLAESKTKAAEVKNPYFSV